MRKKFQFPCRNEWKSVISSLTKTIPTD